MLSAKKEQIKDRLTRLAATYWEVSENEIDANFDPLVNLLFDGLAHELENLGATIDTIKQGLVGDFVREMIPMLNMGAHPAHCVISVHPATDEAVVTPDNLFRTIVKTPAKEKGASEKNTIIDFAPIGAHKIAGASLKYLRVANTMFEYSGNRVRNLFEKDGPALCNEIHFALRMDEPVANLEGLQFYFDLKGHSEAANFYSAIHESELTLNTEPVEWKNSYYKNSQYSITMDKILDNGIDYIHNIRMNVANIYRPQFMLLKSPALFKEDTTAQDIFWNGMPDELRDAAAKQTWVYGVINLKRPFTKELLSRLTVTVNAFPVINYSQEKIFFTTGKWMNIIPLPTKNSFLALKNIEGLNGEQFRYANMKNNKDLAEGEAVLRKSKVGSDSSRQIRKTIQYLLESIRNESAYFSNISNDEIAGQLQHISKVLNNIEDKVYNSGDLKEDFYYLLLKTQKDKITVEINYYTTDPVYSPLVKSGAEFIPYGHAITRSANNVSLSNAFGAIPDTDDFSTKQCLLRQLVSNGKIISTEDIRLACLQLIGKNVKDVFVERRVKINQSVNCGAERVVMIRIEVEKNTFTEEQKYFLTQQILGELNKNSAFVYPFEIEFID